MGQPPSFQPSRSASKGGSPLQSAAGPRARKSARSASLAKRPSTSISHWSKLSGETAACATPSALRSLPAAKSPIICLPMREFPVLCVDTTTQSTGNSLIGKHIMGDFAAGKLLSADGVAHAAVSPDNFDQWLIDVEGRFAREADLADFLARGPAADCSGLPPLLALLLGWKDGGCPIYEYTLCSTAEVAAEGDWLTIGVDLDGAKLQLDAAGALRAVSDESTQELGDFGAYLGKFRNELLANKLEYADGWVSTAGA
eukprot:Transcript_19125.p2 GENE.Transcript_19125~~Transcript_19125.p2  ORF type:complete len:257 (+),score=41.27 Transcript_19125:323-1093(+)